MRGRWIAGVAGAIALSVGAAANGAPTAPSSAMMPGAPANFMGFEDHGGTTYAMQAPAGYAWLRLFGTKGDPVTRSASLTCPSRRRTEGAAYVYTCNFLISDYAPGTYNRKGPRVTRRATGEATLELSGSHSFLHIELGPTTVTYASPPHTAVEPPRTATLEQVPL